jgi:hypothetical protein
MRFQQQNRRQANSFRLRPSRPPHRSEAPTLTHEALLSERSRPRPPRPTEAPTLNTRTLFCRSASVLGRPRPTEAPTLNTRTLFCRSASVLGRPRPTEAPTLTHERSSVGARPSSAAPVQHQPLTHERSSVGARPSSAAPVQQIRTECQRDGSLDGGGRGRPRSD